MRIKLLICLLVSLSVFSSNTILASSYSKKTKTYQKKSVKSKKYKSNKNNKNITKTNSSPSNTLLPAVEEKLSNIEYKCDENQKFTLLGKVETDNNVTINLSGNKVILTRVDTDTGANRFTNQNKGFDLVSMPSKTMLMNTKLGRRLADNCQAPQINAVEQSIQQVLPQNQ